MELWENFRVALAIMGKGLAGIFIVTLVIVLCTMLLCRLTAPKRRDDANGTDDTDAQ